MGTFSTKLFTRPECLLPWNCSSKGQNDDVENIGLVSDGPGLNASFTLFFFLNDELHCICPNNTDNFFHYPLHSA